MTLNIIVKDITVINTTRLRRDNPKLLLLLLVSLLPNKPYIQCNLVKSNIILISFGSVSDNKHCIIIVLPGITKRKI